jgi:hypothetical protein
MSHENGLGKRCPDCGAPMTDLRSLNSRMCSNGACQLMTDWNLSPGQRPLLGNNRIDRKEQTA